MTFDNLNLRFVTVAAFETWLATQPRPQWAPIGSTYHNTYRPTQAQWRGHDSMRSMQATYAAKGWSTGPHLYLAMDTAADGIFVMCPPWVEGIHGVICNKDHFGVENVGDYHATPMSAKQIDLLVGAMAALHRYAGIGANVNAHRDCVARTCPGDAAYAQKPEIQQRLAAALNGTLPPPQTRYTADSPIMAAPGAPLATLRRNFPVSTPNYSVYDIRNVILPAYWTQAVTLGVDPVVAIAQMAHETGALTSWWSARPRRNPAGIGVTGVHSDTEPIAGDWAQDANGIWVEGCSFVAWQTASIPAHLGRLIAYAIPEDKRTANQQRAVDYALSVRPLPPAIHGSAPTLRLLGRIHNPTGQGWASPGETYGAAIADWANRLVM